MIGVSILGAKGRDLFDWFRDSMVNKFGLGLLTKFWKNHWVRDFPVKARFPRVFSIFVQKDFCVGEVGKWEGHT